MCTRKPQLTPSVDSVSLLLLPGHIQEPLQLERRVHDERIDVHKTGNMVEK